MTDSARAAYVASAQAWRGAPEKVYAALAGALVEAAPVPLRGARVLDVGAGTGVAARAALAAGCSDVASLDLADTMLRIGGLVARAVVGDVDRIPFADDAFDLTTASCVLSHVPDPRHTLAEIRRVSRGVVASAFREGWTHPAKPAVDAAAAKHGFVEPQWYADLKRVGEQRLATADRFAALAEVSGWAHVDVRTIDVRTGLRQPAELVQWRLGMAHIAPWFASLPAMTRAELEEEALAALEDPPELTVPVLVLRCRV